ncbi:MAG: class I SAM-dependent methyltransferase [Saprospiraceae bacterium]|nr:class I SAM-dependent methyltransferase [Saprospiraceae bacterium]
MSFKGKIAGVLRFAGLMRFVNSLKFLFQYIKNFSDNSAFKNEFPKVKLPPAYMLFESFNMSYREYYLGGKEVAQWILSIVKPHIKSSEVIVLDWGCGPARIARHLPDIGFQNSVIHGTDYNKATIEWCQKNIQNVTFNVNSVNPPLGYKNETFDLIIGISIFTHLSEPNHLSWIKELARVLKPEGIAFLTTHGEVFRSILNDAEIRQYDSGKLVVRGAVKEGHRIFTAFQPPLYLIPLWSQYFEILEHHEGKKATWGLEQDYWVLKKLG